MSGTVSATTASGSSGSAISQVGTNAIASLSDNFANFLQLLMTQLQNQDPTSPLDSNQFTSELVQFTSVEQQIDTNTDLSKLIQLTQASQVEQSAGMLGKAVTITNPQLSLQNGQATINYTTSSPEPVTISISNASGAVIQSAAGTSQAGQNSWTWNGQSADGTTMPDGAYTVTVTTASSNGQTSNIPFTVTGTATAVTNNAGTVDLSLGSLSVPFSSVTSVGS
jgi:flagellar basal-body rod modification protein FlgD